MLQMGGHEVVSEISILKSKIKYEGLKVVIYAAGDRGGYLATCLKCEGIEIEFFIDGDIDKHLKQFREYTIYHYSKLPEDVKHHSYLALISTYAYESHPEEIFFSLVTNGIGEVLYPFKKEFDLAPYNFICNPYEFRFSAYYMEHKEELIEIFDLLEDKISKDTFKQFIQAYMTMSVFKGEQKPSKKKYFECFSPLEEEIFLNIGSCIGDTIFHFIDNRNEKFKKIYAFEGSEYYYGQLIKNLSIFPQNIRNRIETYNMFLNQNTTDSISDKKITLINMDIEGAEENVILGLEECIKRNRPVLAVCAYHKPSDIVILPKLIKEHFDDYKVYFRKYASSWVSRLEVAELVMYAVPIERMVGE